jgi:hypothetical protein
MGNLGSALARILTAPAWWYVEIAGRAFPPAVQPWPIVLPWATALAACLGFGSYCWKKHRYWSSVGCFLAAAWLVAAPILIGAGDANAHS